MHFWDCQFYFFVVFPLHIQFVFSYISQNNVWTCCRLMRVIKSAMTTKTCALSSVLYHKVENGGRSRVWFRREKNFPRLNLLVFWLFSLNNQTPIHQKPQKNVATWLVWCIVCWSEDRLAWSTKDVGEQSNFPDSCQKLPGQRRRQHLLQQSGQFGWSGLHWRTPAGLWWSWHLFFCT